MTPAEQPLYATYAHPTARLAAWLRALTHDRAAIASARAGAALGYAAVVAGCLAVALVGIFV